MKKLLKNLALVVSAVLLDSAAFAQVPTITSFTPASAPIGAAVTIQGSNFSPTSENDIVYFGAVRATVTAATATSLTVTVPSGATYAPITVTVGGLNGFAKAPFVVTFPGERTITTSAFAQKVDFSSPGIAFDAGIGDLDGDGKSDLVSINASANRVSLYRSVSLAGNINSTSFLPRVAFPAFGNPYTVAIGDLDGDAKLDLAVANGTSDTVSVFRNISASGSLTADSFAAHVDFRTGGRPVGVAIGDLDRDGKPDLVTANQGGNTISILRNTSMLGSITTDSFAAKVDLEVGASPQTVAIADLDGDGRLDIAVANSGRYTVTVRQNVSVVGSLFAGSFAPGVDLTTGSSPVSIAIGDLDGDGRPDIATANYGGSMSLLRNASAPGELSSESFAGSVNFETGGRPYTIAIGDLNGDGKPDIALANAGSHVVSVFQNTTTVSTINSDSLASGVNFAAGESVSVAIGDLDGDGRPDLLLANYDADTVSVYRNTLPGPSQPIIVIQPQNQSVYFGDTVTLTVAASGQAPLAYQWRFNGADISGATSPSFSISDAQSSNAGNYSVVVTNAAGSAVSSNALVSVGYPPAHVKVMNVSGLAGSTVEVPVELHANGAENALGFSLNFDSAQLIFGNATLAVSAPSGATLIVNANEVGIGHVGLAVALPADATFPAGTQPVFVVTFTVGAVSSAMDLPISFGDQPTMRQLADTHAGILPATYSGGVVSVLPTTIRVVNVTAASNGEATVPIELLAEGNENAVGFSLNFDPAVLSFSSVELDPGAPEGAMLLSNVGEVGVGRLGLAVALAAGETFPAGTQRVFQVHFTATAGLDPITTAVSFGDLPTARQVSDSQAHALPSVFTGGSVLIPAVSFEGDAAPRPDGNRTVTIIDWVQLGRFVAGLDAISGPSEYQRVDCAPRSTKGNGVLSVTDWVQAGRYAAGLDPLTIAGGPTSEGGGLAAAPQAKLAGADLAAGRTISVPSQTVMPGTTNRIAINLAAQGNENAIGFSVSFDATMLKFLGATPGTSASSGVLNLNTDQAAAGKLGAVLALQAGNTFPAGAHELLNLRFVAIAAGTTAMAFGDIPVRREVSDATAESLPATYRGGTATVTSTNQTGPTLSIRLTDGNLVVFWPAADSTGFELETAPALATTNWQKVAGMPFVTGGQKIVPVTSNGSNSVFRLKK